MRSATESLEVIGCPPSGSTPEAFWSIPHADTPTSQVYSVASGSRKLS